MKAYTKKLDKRMRKIASLYQLQSVELKLVPLTSGPAWVAEADGQKGLHRVNPMKALKNLEKELDRKLLSKSGTSCLYPSQR